MLKTNLDDQETQINEQKIQEKLNHIDNIRKTNILWNTIFCGPRFYFIDDQQRICGTKETIGDLIPKIIDFGHDWKKKNLRIINFNKKIYADYCEVMTWYITNDNTYKKISCIGRMGRLRAMGNELKKAGMCYRSASAIYELGIHKFGDDWTGLHASCVHNQPHTDLLSELCDNTSYAHYQKNDFESSYVYATLGLIIHPTYQNCIKRLELINEQLSLVD